MGVGGGQHSGTYSQGVLRPLVCCGSNAAGCVCVLTLWLLSVCAGVFAWVAGPLKAGTRCMLVYNCRSGPLAFTNSAKLHLGYDGWYNKEKQVGGGGWIHTHRGVSE